MTKCSILKPITLIDRNRLFILLHKSVDRPEKACSASEFYSFLHRNFLGMTPAKAFKNNWNIILVNCVTKWHLKTFCFIQIPLPPPEENNCDNHKQIFVERKNQQNQSNSVYHSAPIHSHKSGNTSGTFSSPQFTFAPKLLTWFDACLALPALTQFAIYSIRNFITFPWRVCSNSDVIIERIKLISFIDVEKSRNDTKIKRNSICDVFITCFHLKLDFSSISYSAFSLLMKLFRYLLCANRIKGTRHTKCWQSRICDFHALFHDMLAWEMLEKCKNREKMWRWIKF